MYRGRRLRKNKEIRALVRENHVRMDDLIYPIFVQEGEGICAPIESMPGQFQYSIDQLPPLLDEMKKYGVRACLLFGIPAHKDACGSQAYAPEGIIQKAVRAIKAYDPELYVITDVCMCEYTDHGHCGILDEEGVVLNDTTLTYLAKIALSHVEAGADMVAPSDMMDGRVEAIRQVLDENGFADVPILSYAAKYASQFYGPFRDAAHSAPSFSDRKSYQMDPANGKEALREIEADIQEGADAIIIKPAMCYLDILQAAKERFDVPFCVYNVSGEYSMLMQAILNGWIKEDVIEETLVSFKRAGASMIITYFALMEGKRQYAQKQSRPL
ncbi:porphobilinogen synthase [Dubosiella newyorkensis]|uniref:porphobilinogen synthase n=1 Tax=Dubosiella newyorkensis TaxID=1862672 RepID=UPI0032B1B9AE